MEKFVIEGGVPLHGHVTPSGNKNAALPIIAASLLTDEPLTLRNVPRIRDVEDIVEDSYLSKFEVVSALTRLTQSSLSRPASLQELGQAQKL